MTTSTTASGISFQPIASSEEPAIEPLEGDTPSMEPAESQSGHRRRVAVAAAFMLAVIALVAGVASLSGGAAQVDNSLVYFKVQSRDLPITVTERGTLESQENLQVICEVDDIHGDGIYGTPILWIIENGASVEKGDLVVELDSASHLERLDEQIVDTEQARAKYIQAKLHYENRMSRNITSKMKAELDVQLAELGLKQYEDEEGGTFQLELQEVELDIQQQDARKKIDDRNLRGTAALSDLGYKSKGDLAQARLQALRAKSAMQREKLRRRELVTYDYETSKLELTGAKDSAARALIQVDRDNEALLAQAKAWKESAEASLSKEEERLQRYRDTLAKCKLYAPQAGMVAYHVEANRWGQSSSIEEGVAVRERQPILSIPSLTHMQVQTSVHESVVDRVKDGMRATVRLDAFPDRHYEGVVESVAVLPDPGGWLSSDTKVYKTIVTIEEEVQQIKPGMTAVVEMHIDYLTNVLCIPVQAIVQRGEETWCYVAKNGHPQKCPIEVGKTNDKFVEICAGLEEGDRVVLNPAAIMANDPDQERVISSDDNQSDEISLD